MNKNILSLLDSVNKNNVLCEKINSILFNMDGSGTVRLINEKILFNFDGLDQLEDNLKKYI
jgi:hypothetical protein